MLIIDPIITYEPADDFTTVLTRKAVKAICFKKSAIVVLRCDDGSYKLPGGGIEDNDSNEVDALLRELNEECGITEIEQCRLIAHVDEFKPDFKKTDGLFHISTNIYQCQVVIMNKLLQKLDSYEEELNFTVVEVDKSEIMELFNNTLHPWSYRDQLIVKNALKILKQKDEVLNE